jgi:hypothetical protein
MGFRMTWIGYGQELPCHLLSGTDVLQTAKKLWIKMVPRQMASSRYKGQVNESVVALRVQRKGCQIAGRQPVSWKTNALFATQRQTLSGGICPIHSQSSTRSA